MRLPQIVETRILAAGPADERLTTVFAGHVNGGRTEQNGYRVLAFDEERRDIEHIGAMHVRRGGERAAVERNFGESIESFAHKLEPVVPQLFRAHDEPARVLPVMAGKP